MATVTRANIGLLNDKITVKVSQEDYLPNFDKAVKQFSKSANIPGFRKGMVPAGMVKKMHGQAIFADEVLKSVEKELVGYLQQEKLEIFGQPISLDKEAKAFDFNTPASYDFDFEVGLKPEFAVTPLEPGKTELTRYKVRVSEEAVNEEVNRLQLKGGKEVEQDSPTSDDSVLTVTLAESDADGNVVEGGISKDNTFLFKYFTPAVQEQLKGKKKDDAIVTTLGAAFNNEQLEFILKDLGVGQEGADKHFKLTINKVGLIEKRELNEEFFKEVYPTEEITTEEAFRAKLKEEIEKYWSSESRNRMHNDLFEVLVHETPIELPVDFLKRWLQTGGEKPKTAEEAEREYPNFDHQLRWTLISDKLIRDNKLEVAYEEVRAGAKQKLLGYYGGAGLDGAEWLDSYLDRLMQDEKFVDQTYREMITQKLFEWAEDKVNVKEEEITADEFVKLPHKHHHHEH
ncbi:trigger factor [Chitinophaga pendula]|uniref:trigger factor n=1 Tax=Chitinophaga TaxID=79328 RepID=UPI000BAEB963|nr:MULTISPECIES: trigger factor [Chitinophaga]ASZ10911.1 trigger factor [Chitinophaga sp. MD30]UCJ06102.1 trigger factor [Chitinophaga pendula]